jgi:hypothetical protein
MKELMNWTTLGTLAGATTMVLLITQYIKPLLLKIDTRLIALILAVIILEAATAISGGGIQEYAIGLLNAFLVATSAMGAYQVTFKAVDDKKTP